MTDKFHSTDVSVTSGADALPDTAPKARSRSRKAAALSLSKRNGHERVPRSSIPHRNGRDLYDRTVPDVRQETDESAANRWRSSMNGIVGLEGKYRERSHELARIRAVMAYLDYINAPDKKYTEELKSLNFSSPNSKHPFAPAASYLFRWNAGDTSDNRNSSKRITEHCVWYDGYVRLLEKHGIEHAKVPRNPESVRDLASLIDEAGGFAGLVLLAKKDPDPERAPKRIPLDPATLAEECAKRAKKELVARAPVEDAFITVQVVYRSGDSTSEHKLDVSARTGAVEAYLSQLLIADKLIDLLADALHACACIRERMTSRPYDLTGNPNDPKARRRPDIPQLVLHDDGSITISLYLSLSSIVVRIQPVDGCHLLGQLPPGTVRVNTAGRKLLAANLVPREARGAWGLRIEGPGDTYGLCYLVAATPAAKVEADRVKGVRALVQHPTYGENELPLIADEELFDWKAECVVDALAFSAHAKAYPLELSRILARSDRELTLDLQPAKLGDALKIEDGKKDPLIPVRSIQGTAAVPISAEDYTDFLRMLDGFELPAGPNVTCRIDPKGLAAFEFETRTATYHVFLPAFRGGMRSERLMKRMTASPWPSNQRLGPVASA